MGIDKDIIRWEQGLKIEVGQPSKEFRCGTFQQIIINYVKPFPEQRIKLVSHCKDGIFETLVDFTHGGQRINLIPGWHEHLYFTAGECTEGVEVEIILRQLY